MVLASEFDKGSNGPPFPTCLRRRPVMVQWLWGNVLMIACWWLQWHIDIIRGKEGMR